MDVFAHVLAHIFYGHHAYLEKLDDSAYQYPFLMAEPKNKDRLTRERYAMEIQASRHAMEIQADRYAGDVTLTFAFREIWGHQFSSWSSSEKMLKSLEKRAIQEWGTALTIVFNVVESINTEFHTHPHPRYRRLATTMSANVVWASTFRDKSKNIHTNPDEFLNILNDIQEEANDAWHCTYLPSIDPSPDLDEVQFRNLLDQAVQLFPKLDSRFDKYHVI